MFTEDIESIENHYHNNVTYLTNNMINHTSSELDLQYELYAKYMQLSKEQFAVQEMVIIQDTENLLQSLNLSARLDLSKDVSSTMESFSYDEDFDNSTLQEISCIKRSTPKKITRKGTRHSVIKPSGRNTDEFQEIINEIERNCTEHTLSIVKSLLEEHKKNIAKMVDVEKKEKNIRRIEEKTEKVEQENLIFKAKLNEIEEKLKTKDDEIRSLKERLNNFKVTEKENMRSAQKINVSSKFISEEDCTTTISSSQSNKNHFLSQYLDTKEMNITERMKKIQQIETKIETLIEESVLRNSEECNKCCQMIKKIKESVMNYRNYLEEESEECEKMYNMLKIVIENTLQTKNLPDLNLLSTCE